MPNLQYERRQRQAEFVEAHEGFLGREVEKYIALNKQFILEHEAARRRQEEDLSLQRTSGLIVSVDVN